MNDKTVYIKSFGCQMNKLDTALVAAAFKEAGYGLTDSEDEADVVLINTCSVRERAETKVLSRLGNLKHIKETRPHLIVGVIGCMAQRLGGELLEYKMVDIVAGPAQIPRIVELVNTAIERKTIAVTDDIRKKLPAEQTQALEDFESVFDHHDKDIVGQAFVRAMRGCNNFCSYCVVPYVRGPEVSRPVKLVVEQVRRLAGEGVKLVTLLGQTVNAYEYIEDGKTYCLADLLEEVSKVEGIEWIRFVTSYPQKKYFEEILGAMRDLPKVCRYLHMPAQSGSDKILKAMNRKYTASEYIELLDKARETVPGIALSGDFIVGFPNETDEDFQATVDLVQKAQYKNCFVFKYSPRPGTKAEGKLRDSVSIEIKKRRNNELLAVQEKISNELSGQFLNKKVTVLVEGLSKKPHLNAAENGDNPQLIGRTDTDWIVVFNGPVSLAGEFAQVKITKTTPLTLFADLI